MLMYGIGIIKFYSYLYHIFDVFIIYYIWCYGGFTIMAK